MWRIPDNWDTPQILQVVGQAKHLDKAFIFIVNLIVSHEHMWFSWEQKCKILVCTQIFIAIVFSKIKSHREHHKYHRDYWKFVKLGTSHTKQIQNSNW